MDRPKKIKVGYINNNNRNNNNVNMVWKENFICKYRESNAENWSNNNNNNSNNNPHQIRCRSTNTAHCQTLAVQQQQQQQHQKRMLLATLLWGNTDPERILAFLFRQGNTLALYDIRPPSRLKQCPTHQTHTNRCFQNGRVCYMLFGIPGQQVIWCLVRFGTQPSVGDLMRSACLATMISRKLGRQVRWRFMPILFPRTPPGESTVPTIPMVPTQHVSSPTHTSSDTYNNDNDNNHQGQVSHEPAR